MKRGPLAEIFDEVKPVHYHECPTCKHSWLCTCDAHRDATIKERIPKTCRNCRRKEDANAAVHHS